MPLVVPSLDGAPLRDAFFKSTIADLVKLTADGRVLVNIPVWGYPGHGKTSSILTAIQYCKPHIHGASLALVTDIDDLSELGEAYPKVKQVDLRTVAETTRSFLGELKERFFRDNEWPDATEQPAQYLLEIQAVSGTLGYAVIPDLRGGSFESSDDISKNALSNAHAMIILVNPAEYIDEENPRSADYKKEVLRRIQRCARESLPTCVMITMADSYGESGDAADQTEKELTCLIAGQDSSFGGISRLSRVSVLGGHQVAGEKPPPAKDRRPDELIEAWIWTLHQALTAERSLVRNRPPELNLRAEGRGGQSVEVQTVPTLRQAGKLEAQYGNVVAAIPETNDQAWLFLFVGSDGKLIELSVQRDRAEATVIREYLAPEPIPGDLGVEIHGAIIAAGSTASSVIYGTRGGALIKTSLPVALRSWTLAEPKRIVGFSADGSLHSLYLRGETWEDTHHLPNFIPIASMEKATCSFIDASRLVIVATGAEVLGAELGVRGRFGNVVRPQVAAKYDGERVALNRSGYFAAVLADGNLVGGREKQVQLGLVHPDPNWPHDYQLAPSSPHVAWISPAAKLRAALLSRAKTATTPEELSPLLGEVATGLCWSSDGEILLVSTKTGITWFEARGLV